MKPLRILIVDDEPPARLRLRQLLDRIPDTTLVGEAEDGPSAVAAIRRLAPDLVFLDVQMPGLDGFGVVAEVTPEAMPAVVFVTAYDQHALRAFEAHALDYLLKPFADERFQAALDRAREVLRRDRLAKLCGQLQSLLDTAPSAAPSRLAVRSAGRVALVDRDDIDWVEAAGNYVRLHLGTTSRLLRRTLASLETDLDPSRFIRIHRSTLVNVDRIRELRSRPHGEADVVLVDGTELRLSRSYRDRLDPLLG